MAVQLTGILQMAARSGDEIGEAWVGVGEEVPVPVPPHAVAINNPSSGNNNTAGPRRVGRE